MIRSTTSHFSFLALLAAMILVSGIGTDIIQAQSLRVGQPFRVYPSNVMQTETFVVRHPLNSNILFASASTINLGSGFTSEGIYVSTNAGQTWRGNDTCTGAPISFHRGDPAIAIDKNGTFLLTRYGFPGPPTGIYFHSSTDLGLTWSSQRTITSQDADRASLVSDIIPASSFYGRSYAAWVRLSSPYPVYYSYTDDGGANWSAPAQVNSPSPRSQGAELSIGPNGRTSLCWARVVNISPYIEDFVGFATSTDGGANWSISENAFDVNGIQGTFPQKGNIRVNGLPKIDTDNTGGPRHGWIYIVTTQRNLLPAGSDPDIILNRSSNNGHTWSGGIRVNQDPLNNGKTQFFPAIHIDDGGGINVIYYDDRDTTPDSTGVYLSRSTDGGDTWSDHPIGTQRFKPSFVALNLADNIGMTSVGTTLWPIWMDNSSGIYQMWACPIDLVALNVDESALPSAFELLQNFPNPFNPTTQISFRLAEGGDVTLRIYDVLGREVSTLVDERLQAGNHSRAFDAYGLGGGVYFYRLQSGQHSQTMKMLLLK